MRNSRGVARALVVFGAAGMAATTFAQRAPQPGEPGWTSLPPLPLEAPIAVCFMEGTDPRYVEAITMLVDLQNQAFFGMDYFTATRWSGAVGTPRALTWSFVPDGLTIPNGVGEPSAPSNLFARMDTAYASQGGRATWMNRFQQVFDRWAQFSGLSYTRVRWNNNDWDDGASWGSGGSAGNRGDVRIGMKQIDGGGGVLAYNAYPPGGDMVLDSGDINNYGSSSNQNRFLRNVVAHEHGHGIGLQHVCTHSGYNILMEPFISTSYDGPRHDDMRASMYLYGDASEINSTFGGATALGALAIGTPINAGNTPNPLTGSNDPQAANFCLENTGALDWYSFTTTGPLAVTVTAAPIGLTYGNSTQQQAGSNCSGTINQISSLTPGNLVVQVYGSNGTTVLGVSDNTPAGQPEVLTNVSLPDAGTYFVRISTSNSHPGGNTAQLYKLTLSGSTACANIINHPQSQAVCEGTNAVLTATVGGSPTPTLQWRKDGENLTDGAHISGATTSTLTITSVGTLDAGDYDLVAINNCGPATSNPATLTVNASPSFTQQPQSQTVPLGSPVTFSVQAQNAASYQWTQDGVFIIGATSPSYIIQSVSSGDEGEYRCIASGPCGSAASTIATLTIGTGGACYANCDGSSSLPFLNVNDFVCFQQRFAAGDPYANCDESTAAPILNVNDFVCFQQRFAAGCSAP